MLFDFETLPAPERYKLLTATIVPRPIAWVVTQDAEGRRNAAPYSFFNAVASDPPTIILGVGARGGGRKDTLANILALGEFTVCMVSAPLLESMNVTAIDFAPEVDELEEAGLATVASEKVRPPRIADSPVALECALHQTIPLGEHTLVLGRVRALHVRDDCVLNPARRYIDTPALELVGRMHGAGWYARTTDRVELPRMTTAQWEAKKEG